MVDIKLLIEDLRTVKSDSEITFSLFGPPGTGKTSLACTFPKPLLVDFDRGSKAVERDQEISAFRVRYNQYDGDNNFINVSDFINAVFEYLESNSLKFQTVIIDTVSELQQLHLLEISRKAHFDNPSKRPNKLNAEIQDYKLDLAWMREVIRGFNSLPMHKVYVSHEIIEQDDTSKLIKITPHVTPKFRPDFLGRVDIAGYLHFVGKPPERILTIRGTDTLDAKARIARNSKMNELEEIVNPTFEKIMDVMFEGWRKNPEVKKISKGKVDIKPVKTGKR